MEATEDHKENAQKCRQMVYLEFRLSSSSFWVTEEGDKRGSESVLFVVVLGTVAVGQLDQAVVVRQTGVCFAETPRSLTRDAAG